jgi:hypothetical protein
VIVFCLIPKNPKCGLNVVRADNERVRTGMILTTDHEIPQTINYWFWCELLWRLDFHYVLGFVPVPGTISAAYVRSFMNNYVLREQHRTDEISSLRASVSGIGDASGSSVHQRA